jgi:hypothetical protein
MLKIKKLFLKSYNFMTISLQFLLVKEYIIVFLSIKNLLKIIYILIFEKLFLLEYFHKYFFLKLLYHFLAQF